MTLAERGAYTDLLFFQWDTGPLPNNPGRLARMLGVPEAEFLAIWPALQGKFKIGDREVWNERIERERLKSVDLRRKASDKAAQAAKARWGSDASSNASSNAQSNASSTNSGSTKSENMLGAMLEQCPPSPSASPSSSSSAAHIVQEGERGNQNGKLEQTASTTLAPPKEDSKEVRLKKAATLMKASPELPIAQVAKMYKLSEKEVAHARPA